jgi:hypothetical protein
MHNLSIILQAETLISTSLETAWNIEEDETLLSTSLENAWNIEDDGLYQFPWETL